MKKVRMLTLMAGPDGLHFAGQEVELPDGQAQDLIDGGYAEEVIASDMERRLEEPEEEPGEGDAGSEDLGEEFDRETAAMEAPEKAIAPKKTRKRRKSSS